MTFLSTDAPVAGTHTWLTPKPIIDALGPFDLDPCAAPEPRPFATAKTMNSIHDGGVDGLSLEWFGRVWLNPPYSDKPVQWLHKLKLHGNGIALVFARTDTAWLQGVIADSGVFFIRGRISFMRPDGSFGNNAGAPSVLLPFGEENVAKVLTSGIDGVWKP